MVEYLDGGRIQGSSTASKLTNKTGLRAYYDFNNASGNLLNKATAIGSSDSNGVDLQNTNLTQNVAGKFDKCYNNGTSYNGGVSHEGSLGSAGANTNWEFMYGSGDRQWTFTGWVKRASATQADDANFFDNTNSASGTGIKLSVRGDDRSDDGALQLTLIGDGDYSDAMWQAQTADDFLPSDTNWHFIVVTCDLNSASNQVNFILDNGTPSTHSFVAGSGSSSYSAGSSGHNGNPEYTWGLNAIARSTSSKGSFQGFVDDYSFWSRILGSSEITTLYGSALGIDEKDDITNIPANTRYEETDTRKIYRFVERTTTFEDDFSGSNTWTSDGTDVAVNASTDVIDWDSDQSSSGQDQLYKDLTTVSDTKWFVDFDITFTTVGASGSSTNGIFLLVVLDSITADANTVGHDALGIAYEVDNTPTNQASIEAFSCDDKNLYDAMEMNTPTGTVSLFNETAQASETQYIRMVRDGSTFTVHLYSSSARTGTPIESEEVDATDGGTVSGLRYLKIMTSRDNTGDHEFTGTIDNVKFYNGVTSPTAWIERGVAS